MLAIEKGLLLGVFDVTVFAAGNDGGDGGGQNYLARHSERGKKTRRTEEEVGRQYQGMNRSNSPSPRGQWIIEKMEETGCKIICGAPTTLAVKGQMMMMMVVVGVCLCFCVCARTRARVCVKSLSG